MITNVFIYISPNNEQASNFPTWAWPATFASETITILKCMPHHFFRTRQSPGSSAVQMTDRPLQNNAFSLLNVNKLALN